MSFGDGDVEVAKRIVASGYELDVIYDIGGSSGAWTRSLRPVFPNSRIELFEPLGDHDPHYRAGLDGLRTTDANLGVHIAAVGAEDGEVEVRVFPDASGSTTLPGDGGQPIVRAPRRSIDSLIAGGLRCPDLIKADTQGGEFDIIRGAEANLAKVSFLLLETWLVRGYGAPTPLLSEQIAYLHPRGFVPYDFADTYRKDDRLIAQDVWFINVRKAKDPPWYYMRVLN
jgi:FkbM family methyltransferase